MFIDQNSNIYGKKPNFDFSIKESEENTIAHSHVVCILSVF